MGCLVGERWHNLRVFLLDDQIVYSASDLSAAASCEFALLRQLDARTGLISAEKAEADPMLERTSSLGDSHEREQLQKFIDQHGDGVVVMPRPEHSRAGLTAATLATVEAARSGAPVIYQGTFFDGRFLGFCDFLVREGDTYAVYDSKLSRHAKVSALLQLAAYADALERNAIAASDQVHLLLGDGSTSSHDIGDIAPVFAARRAELERVLDVHRAEGKPTQWLDDRYLRCGRCDTCSVEVENHRDLLLVAGVRGNQREQLIVSGITTIDELAVSTGPVEGIRRETLDKLRAQAAVQLRQEQSGDAEFEVYEPSALGGLPVPDDGDIFFDFEGAPTLGRGRIHRLGAGVPVRRGRRPGRRLRVQTLLGTRSRG